MPYSPSELSDQSHQPSNPDGQVNVASQASEGMVNKLQAETSAGLELQPVIVHTAAAPAFANQRIGEILVRSGRLKADDVQRITAYQHSHGLRFGEAAIALGLLTEPELQKTVAQQYRYPVASDNADLAQFTIATAPFGSAAESIRKLRTEITLRHNGQFPLSIAIVSPNEQEGKTYLSASLALAFAQNGSRTLLVNADLRAPEKGSLLGTHTDTGLSILLSGRGITGATQPVPSFPLLHTLDAGPRPPNPAEILRDPMLKNMLGSLRLHFDIIIVDTPAAKLYPDAQLIARQVDTTIIIARQHLTSLADLEQVQESLSAVMTPITGIVYNSYQEANQRADRWPFGSIRRWLQRLKH